MRRPWQCQRQFRLSEQYGLPTQAAQGLANRSHTDPKPPCNLIVRAALSLELLNFLSPRSLQAGTPRGITAGTSQSRQAALPESFLMASDRAHRVAKGPSHGILVRPPQLDQAHHRVGFGHAIAHGILRQGNARHENHAVTIKSSEIPLCLLTHTC